jgi:beta-lactamase class A
MKNQRYREGIPAGSDFTVADKVGFLDGYLTDGAIVYAGDRPYVLVVFTYGESWSLIANITRQIETLVL